LEPVFGRGIDPKPDSPKKKRVKTNKMLILERLFMFLYSLTTDDLEFDRLNLILPPFYRAIGRSEKKYGFNWGFIGI
jgi:hypothetical protein